MQKEIFTRAEVKALIEEAVKRTRKQEQEARKRSQTHGNGYHDNITTGSDTGGSTPSG